MGAWPDAASFAVTCPARDGSLGHQDAVVWPYEHEIRRISHTNALEEAHNYIRGQSAPMTTTV
jgi:hypothetical protein